MAFLNRIGWSVVGLALYLATGGPLSADVVVVVASANPVAALSKAQVTDIFLGKSTRFPDGA